MMTRFKETGKAVAKALVIGAGIAVFGTAFGFMFGLLITFAADVFQQDFVLGLLLWLAAMSIMGAVGYGVCHYVGIFDEGDTND